MGQLQKFIQRVSDKFPFGFGITMFINMIFYAMVSTVLFSFLPKMVKYFGASEVETGYKAGLIATSFYIGQFVFSMAWGYAADTIQLRYALILAGTCLSATTVLFGLSRTFYWAFIARFLQGSSMGHLIIFKILINVVCEERHVAFGLSLMMSAFTVGSIVGPSIGGFLAFPADQYPDIISHENIFGKFGILLPNLVLVFGVVMGILLAIVYLPKNKKVSSKAISDDLTNVELQQCATTKKDAVSSIKQESEMISNGIGNQTQNSETVSSNTENTRINEKDTLRQNNTQIKFSTQHVNVGYSEDDKEVCADSSNDATHSHTDNDTMGDATHSHTDNDTMGDAANFHTIVDVVESDTINNSDTQKPYNTMRNDTTQETGSSTPDPLRNDVTDIDSKKSVVNAADVERAENQIVNDNNLDIEGTNDDNGSKVRNQPINDNNLGVGPISIEKEDNDPISIKKKDNQSINRMNVDTETNNGKNVNFQTFNSENSVTKPMIDNSVEKEPISDKNVDNKQINDVPIQPINIKFSQKTNAPTTKTKRSTFVTIKNSKLGQVLRTRNALISVFLYMFFSMLDIGYSEILPILTSTSVAYRGMGMTPSQLGTLFLIAPTCYFIPQVIFGPKLIGRYGAKCSFIGLNLVMAFSYAVLPIMSAIEGRTLLNVSLIALIIVIRVSAFGCFVAANMLVNNSVPPNLLGTINGFSSSATALGRLVAPILFGGMYSWSLTNIVGVHGNKHPLGFPFNQFFTFFVLALCSVFIAVITTNLPDSINDKK